MSDDLVRFLRARLGEDEAQAGNLHDELECRTYGPVPLPCNCGHPARALREVEAKRAILAECEQSIRDQGIYGEDGQGPLAEGILYVFAAVYSDHPDYRQEWKP